MSASLSLIPLGGLGEIGMNAMAIEHDGAIVLVDCGMTIPFGMPGVDVVHPDFSWLLERRRDVVGLVLTHGHEDHIGAVPYLLRDLPLPIFGPRYALALLEERLSPLADVLPAPVETHPGDPFQLGPFQIEPISVTHSIPDATALAFRTGIGTVLHSGDFNIDPTPLGSGRFDEDRFRALGDEGVRLLLSDSTNVMREGSTGSESGVRDALRERIREAPERVILSLFPSNAARLGAVLELARSEGRKVLALGRSVRNHLRVGPEAGIFRDPSAILVHPDKAREVPRGELLVLATGTQGEAPAALSRLARDVHPDLSVEPGDRVIMSSCIIPGHEPAVFAMIDAFERRGVTVLHRGLDPRIHVSGHACRGEQARLIELVRPRAFLPVHGTVQHMRLHAELAASLGVTETLTATNGDRIEVDAEGMRITGRVAAGRVHVDGGQVLAEEVLNERGRVGALGMAVVALAILEDGSLAGPARAATRGVVTAEEEPDLARDASEAVAQSLRDRADGLDEAAMREQASRTLRRFLGRRLGRKPLCDAMVTLVEDASP